MTTNRLRWIALLAALPVAGAAEPSTDPAVSSLAAGPLPLVLKDGRIARVGVYRIPFATGSAEPEATAARELGQLAASWATDCFLTAQAIGHVAPGPGRDGDTLAAHRLARARADRVQATLAGAGLPEQAIASVWDWQFFVPESRVTLWVFQLVPGEDCDGTPLAAREPRQPSGKPVAEADEGGMPESPRPAATSTAATLVAGSDTGADSGSAAIARSAGSPEDTLPATVGGREAPEPVRITSRPGETAAPQKRASAGDEPASGAASAGETSVATVADAAREESASATATRGIVPAPTAAAQQREEPAPAARATTVAAETPTAPASPPAAGTSTDDAEAVFAVQFDVNSSFLPRGAGEELRRFVERLGEGRWAIRLEGAVAADDVRNARTPEQARRYSEWLTSRRVGRVREWLERHAGERIADVEEELVENDPSRRVVVRARRLP